jgi:hypothetical protein
MVNMLKCSSCGFINTNAQTVVRQIYQQRKMRLDGEHAQMLILWFHQHQCPNSAYEAHCNARQIYQQRAHGGALMLQTGVVENKKGYGTFFVFH